MTYHEQLRAHAVSQAEWTALDEHNERHVRLDRDCPYCLEAEGEAQAEREARENDR